MRQDDPVAMHNRHNRYFAILAFALAMVAYLLTVSPTVAFWDCGEYIGAAHSLGIPHPPGNPLYVMLGRVFSVLLPFFSQVAYRVNLISVLSGAFTVLFLYLIVVRATIGWLGTPDTTWKRATVYVGGLVGALWAGFGSTFWFSAVEAETNVVSMLFVAAGTWLALKWAQSNDQRRDRLLVLIGYLVFLGIGIHMMSMLAIVPVGLFVLLVDKEKLTDWRFWSASILLFSVMYSMSLFLFAAPLLILLAAIYTFVNYKDSRLLNVGLFTLAALIRLVIDLRELSQKTIDFGTVMTNSLPFVVLLIIAVVEVLQDDVSHAVRFRKHWRFIFWLAFFAVLGYSVHLFIPIRSTLRPFIDENHPADFESFMGFLERKQYGSDNMVLRMFHRRGDITTQFGIDGHMGYGGFHMTQFYHFGKTLDQDRDTSLKKSYGTGKGMLILLIYLLPTFFMFFGWYYLWGRSRNTAVLLISLVVLGTVGLVFYMNFADGTRMERQDYEYYQRAVRSLMSRGMGRAEAQAKLEEAGQVPRPVHREVRVRDYFFTSGFMWYGVWIGVAASCLLHLLFTSASPGLRTMAPIIMVLLAASPALPFASNLGPSSRKGDWVPYDYAFNLLMSCDKDGVLFTNGDNDTFPLWFLQEAELIRRDVRIVNLSLLNTKWYILQLKNIDPKLKITYSDDEIVNNLPHERNPFEKDTKVRLPHTKLEVVIPGRERHPIWKVQDKLILNIVDANNWERPIFLAVTVSEDNRMGLTPYLTMEGLVYRVNPKPVAPRDRIDVDRTMYLLDQVYRYKSLGTKGLNMSETTYKLLANYSAGYMYVAYHLREPLMRMRSEVTSLRARIGAGDEQADSLAAVLDSTEAEYQGTLDQLLDKMDECVALMPWDWRPRTLRHELLMSHGRPEEALKRARQGLIINPDWSDYKKMLAQAFDSTGHADSANEIYRTMLDTDADPWFSYLTLAQNHAAAGEFDSAVSLMRRFQQAHPGDKRAASLISYFEQQRRKAAAPSPQDTQAALQPSAPGQNTPAPAGN